MLLLDKVPVPLLDSHYSDAPLLPLFAPPTNQGEHGLEDDNESVILEDVGKPVMHKTTGYYYTFTKAPKNGFPQWEFSRKKGFQR